MGFFGKILEKLGGLLGGGHAAPGGASGGLASMLDLDGNGNPLDDILRMAGKAMRQACRAAARISTIRGA